MSKDAKALEAEELELEIWRLKRQIERLERLEPSNSVVTLIAPPSEDLPSLVQMLNQEKTKADCIKSRVNRQAVQTAIVMAANRVQSYGRNMPKNGLCVFCGEAYEEGKLRKIAIDFSPCKPISNYLYSCDGRFHVDEVRSLLTLDDTYGFMIMDGHGVLFATLCGNHKKILYRQLVDLPKKHGRGGQSSVRFARLREEARHNYVHIVAENCVKYFIDQQTNMPNVQGIIFAGSAEFKDVLAQSDLLDERLKRALIRTVDIAYGMEQGLQQAIELSADVLKDVKLLKEVNAIKDFLDHIARDTQKAAFGLVDVVRCLDMGAAETILLWEDYPCIRYVYRDNDGKDHVGFRPRGENSDLIFVDDEFTPLPEHQIIEQQDYAEYIAEKKKEMNIKLQLVTDQSSEGAQFCQGFGGLAAILRWQQDMNEYARNLSAPEQAVEFSDLSDFM